MQSNAVLTNELQKQFVCSTYDSNAIKYYESSAMQSSNLINMLDYIKSNKINIEGKILDIGCGLGTARTILNSHGIHNIDYIGIDISQGMLDMAIKLTPQPSIFLKADAEALPFRSSEFDFVLSNSTYHWLNVPEINLTPKRAWQEAYRVLRQEQYLAFSISGLNTAKKFQECYHEIADTYKGTDKFNDNLYRLDPIGSMTLQEVKKTLTDIGFEIVFSTNNYEPVEFDKASEYVDAVEAYGYDMYMSPFYEAVKKEVWKELKAEFVKHIGRGKYLHDQFMIYIIAKKTSANTRIASSGA